MEEEVSVKKDVLVKRNFSVEEVSVKEVSVKEEV